MKNILHTPFINTSDWTVICDFDGTITPFDVTDAVLEKFARPEWEDVEEKWLAGDITARQCMEKQVALIETPQRSLDDFLDGIPVTSGFADFYRFCREKGLNMLVVSDGMDYAIKRVLARHGLTDVPVIANRLRCREGGYRLEFPYGAEGCPSGVCKCSVAAATGAKTLLVGDGRSDCCLSANASFTLAKQEKDLERHCVENGHAHAVFNDFFDVTRMVRQFMASRGQGTGRELLVKKDAARTA